MKKRYIVLMVILIIIGVPMLNYYRMKQEINQEMQRVARSDSAKKNDGRSYKRTRSKSLYR